MDRVKANEANLRRFGVSPRNRVLSSPKFDLNKIAAEQEQRVRNYIYKKSNLLGKGYSSKVYKAYKSQELYKPYAIKVIDLTNLNYEQRKNLQAQLKVHKIISHPNIVKCHETFKTTSAYYLVLEYCQHGTLSDYLKSHKKLDQNSVINIISQVFQAYIYLIDSKILHRDLKPQNVLRRDNVWKITDFGFCHKLENQTFEDDINVGTPLYMPIESLIKNIYSHKSDIYSIGVMTYKMLTGSTPWKCSTEKELIQLMTTQKINFPKVKNRFLDEFLRKSLQMDVEKRLDTDQFKELFRKIKQEQNQMMKQLGSELRKFESSRSMTTAESTTSSKIDLLSVKQPSFNSSFNSSTQQKKSINPEFMQNEMIISNELQICRMIHHILLNIDSFIVTDNIQNPESGFEIHCNTKQVLITFFYKFVLKRIRTLNTYFSTANETQIQQSSRIGIRNLSEYRKSPSFTMMAQLLKERLQFYEAEFLQSYIKKSILTIRFINKKFSQLGQNVPLGSSFYKNFLEFIKPSIQSLNSYILQNLQRAKIVNKNLKKDRILALAFWIRLYIQFMQKYKILQQQQTDLFQQYQGKKFQPESLGSKDHQVSKKSSQKQLLAISVSKQLEKLDSIKKSIRIEYLYNFKETNLEFKQFLSLRKKLGQLLEISL